MQVSVSPSWMFTNSAWVVELETVFWSMTNAAGVGVWSTELQFGPREPMKEVLPIRVLPSTVKFLAPDIAIPYPKAPVN